MITIITHPSPDGDAIGSSLGLLWYLKSIGNTDVKVVLPDKLSDNLKFLPGQEFVLDFSIEANKGEIVNRFKNSERVFILDFNSLERIGDLGRILDASKAHKTMVDHHQQPQKIADIIISNVEASSTAEMIYEYIITEFNLYKLSSLKHIKEIAMCLYCGIMTDTGSFRFPNTTSKVHRIIANLLELGANHTVIHDSIYSTFSKERLKMTGHVITNNLIIKDDWAIIWISQEEKEKFDYQKGDTEGLVNYPLSVNGIKRVCFLSEDGGIVKMSFRSKGDKDMSELCRKHFNGGGHKNAAGGRSDYDLKQTIGFVEKVFSGSRLKG